MKDAVDEEVYNDEDYEESDYPDQSHTFEKIVVQLSDDEMDL